MDDNRPILKGRGAAIIEALKRRQAEKSVGIERDSPEKVQVKTVGRAQLLSRLRDLRLSKVGNQDDQPTTSTSIQKERIVSSEQVPVPTPVTFTGTKGRTIDVTSNYIRLHVEKNRGVYKYVVKMDPELDSRTLRFKVIDKAMINIGLTKIFDGATFLYLPRELSIKESTATVELEDFRVINLKFIFKRKERMGECLQLYNVLFRRIMHCLLYTRIGLNHFDLQRKFLIPQHKLEVLPGYAVSVDELDDGLMICLDTQHRVIRNQTAYELMTDLRYSNPKHFKEMASQCLIGSCIFTPYSNKTYTVDDIAWDMNPKDKFETRDGRNISFLLL